MKYWQVLSVFSDEKELLCKVQLFISQKLLCPTDKISYNLEIYANDLKSFFLESKKEFFIKGNYLYLYKHESNESTLSAYEAFIRFGGEAIEEVLEKSSYKIPDLE